MSPVPLQYMSSRSWRKENCRGRSACLPLLVDVTVILRSIIAYLDSPADRLTIRHTECGPCGAFGPTACKAVANVVQPAGIWTSSTAARRQPTYHGNLRGIVFCSGNLNGWRQTPTRPSAKTSNIDRVSEKHDYTVKGQLTLGRGDIDPLFASRCTCNADNLRVEQFFDKCPFVEKSMQAVRSWLFCMRASTVRSRSKHQTRLYIRFLLAIANQRNMAADHFEPGRPGLPLSVTRQLSYWLRN